MPRATGSDAASPSWCSTTPPRAADCAGCSTAPPSRATRSAALQQALELAAAAEPLERKLRVEGQKTGRLSALDLPGQIEQARALGILTEREAQLLADYDRRVMQIINVDDFAPHELGMAAAMNICRAPIASNRRRQSTRTVAS